jgi:hypothetical protein
MRLLDHATDVVAEDFAKDFIHHRHIRFAPNVIAELRLYHREYGLDVATFVVVPVKIFAVELE